MALAKRKKASIAGMDDAGLGVSHGTDWITKKADTAPAATKQIIPRGAGHPIIRGNINRHKAALAAANTPGHGTAVAPPGILNPYRAPRTHGIRGINRAKGGRIGAKKGGSVTGIAKRGFGRALMGGKK